MTATVAVESVEEEQVHECRSCWNVVADEGTQCRSCREENGYEPEPEGV